MILIICNSYREYVDYMRTEFSPLDLSQIIETGNFGGAYSSDSLNTFLTVNLKEIRFINNPLWLIPSDLLILTRLRKNDS